MSGGLPHYSGLGGLGSQGQAITSSAWAVQQQMALHNAQLAQQQFAQQLVIQTQGFLAPAVPRTPMPRWLKPDPKQPDTMGWRAWVWSPDAECLTSPHQQTPWPHGQHVAAHWGDEDAVRGVAGIHARLVPRHWKIVGWPDDSASSGLDENPNLVTGIVERFGRYVLGTEGWRAEQVIIRELLAPSTKIGLALEQKYPDAVVHYPDQIEDGEVPCKSEKSSALEKGSRPSLSPLLLPPSPPPPSPPQLSPTSFPAPHPLMNQPFPLVSWSQSDETVISSAATSIGRFVPIWFGLAVAWVALLGVRFLA